METKSLARMSRGKRLLWGGAALVLGVAFLFDLAIPDCLPFVDEILAGGLTLIAGFQALRGMLTGKGDGGAPTADGNTDPRP